jgi:hypothetical protein
VTDQSQTVRTNESIRNLNECVKRSNNHANSKLRRAPWKLQIGNSEHGKQVEAVTTAVNVQGSEWVERSKWYIAKYNTNSKSNNKKNSENTIVIDDTNGEQEK